jgi:hypothetical protein
MRCGARQVAHASLSEECELRQCFDQLGASTSNATEAMIAAVKE